MASKSASIAATARPSATCPSARRSRKTCLDTKCCACCGRRGNVPVDFELIERFGLAGDLGKRVATLSGGTRQKLNAVAAYLFRPSIVILDEPSAGLDPLSNRALKRKILQTRDAGVTHVITSHVLSEVEQLADDVLMLLDGRVHYSGSLHDLRCATGEQHLEPAIGRLMEASGR
jgi:Cu-processing system ATP-binding protein